MQTEDKPKIKHRFPLLLLVIVSFSALYRSLLVFFEGFPPGADIGLHNSLMHSITQGGNTNFLFNTYHMGGGNSNTFPGYHIFVSSVALYTGLPDYFAQAIVVILFSSLLVATAFLITRRILNESIALIVAFLVGILYYDIFILLWSGYPNIIALLLIPLVFYLLLEKDRFTRLPRLTAAALLSATIFLTHSLSSIMFIVISLAVIVVGLSFPRKLEIARRDVLEWGVVLFIGGLIVSPFLIQAAPIYLDLNSAVYTGGLPDIQALLLPLRLVQIEFVLPFFVCFFAGFAYFKFMQRKVRFPAVLILLWLGISVALTQSFVVGFYTDYERFLYFANLPLIIIVGTGIFLVTQQLAKVTNRFLSAKRLTQVFNKTRFLRSIQSHLTRQTVVVLFATLLLFGVVFGIPHFSMIPSEGFEMRDQLQVMDRSGYEALQWIGNNTPVDSVFVADALYGWWLGGAQRPTVSAVDPIFLTNAREFQPALLATRLLDANYLIDNGLIQLREDGYGANRNPEFLVKQTNEYYPTAFLSFNHNQTAFSYYTANNNQQTTELSELTIREMALKTNDTTATLTTIRGNEWVNFTQTLTVYQGIQFVNITQTLSSNNLAVGFTNMELLAQTRGTITVNKDQYVAIEDPYTNIAGQLIFANTQPTVTQTTNNAFKLCFNLTTQSQVEINFYVSVFEYLRYDSDLTTKTELEQLFLNNTKSYTDKISEDPIESFDYKQALIELNVGYVVLRDYAQIQRFRSDPTFQLVFYNQRTAIFQVRQSSLSP